MEGKRFCFNCGREIDPKAYVCVGCGVKQPGWLSHKAGFQGKNQTTAGLLAILLGGIGLHKFYLGQWKIGILYVVFCWTFIPALIGFIEGIVYLVSSEEWFRSKILRETPQNDSEKTTIQSKGLLSDYNRFVKNCLAREAKYLRDRRVRSLILICRHRIKND